jgi:hypothetical protein
MTSIGKEMILIKIATPNACDTFSKIQHGIIDTVQHIIGANANGNEVILDAKTAKSLCVMLETLRGTLVDPETVQAAMELAALVMPPPEE